MRPLRALVAALLLACGTPEPAAPPPPPAPTPAPAPVAPPPATSAPTGPAVGEVIEWTGTFPRIWPEPGELALGGERPTLLLFWSPSSKQSRQELVRLDRWVAEQRLRERMDVVALAGKAEGVGPDDIRDLGAVLAIEEVALALDPGAGLARRLGVQDLPQLLVLAPDRTILAAGLRSLEHAGLTSPERPEPLGARDYLLAVAEQRTGPRLGPVPPFAPSAAAPPEPTGWAFPLKVNDEAGAEVDLASFEGRPAIVHFWATWCQPCRAELPHLLEALPTLEQHARVVLVSLDTDPHALDRYRRQTGIEVRSYLSPHGGLAEQLDLARSVPRTYVLDAHGGLEQVLRGTFAWEDERKLARFLERLR